VSLKLSDFDWEDETCTVRRTKNGLVQIFPIQFNAGRAILDYILTARPSCSSRLLFVTLAPPHRSMGIASVSNLVRKRVESRGIQASLKTPHAFRHACATELLNKGFSLAQIADFLGHKGLDTVSTYAKCSRAALRCVADFPLGNVYEHR
jgi:integrase/recombinase XerD